MFRKSLSPRRYSNTFKRQARKTKAVNLRPQPRGGTRL